MRLPITPLNTLLRALRSQVRQQLPGGRIVVAVDGLQSDARRAFADAFAEILAEDDSAVFRAGLDAFLLPRAQRSAAGLGPESFDADALRRALLDPFHDRADTASTTGFQLGVWDPVRDRPLEAKWVTAPEDAILVLDGPFLLQQTLRGAWNWSVWLEGADELSEAGTTLAVDPAAAAAYVLQAQPARWANAIVDVNPALPPQQVYRDFC